MKKPSLFTYRFVEEVAERHVTEELCFTGLDVMFLTCGDEVFTQPLPYVRIKAAAVGEEGGG